MLDIIKPKIKLNNSRSYFAKNNTANKWLVYLILLVVLIAASLLIIRMWSAKTVTKFENEFSLEQEEMLNRYKKNLSKSAKSASELTKNGINLIKNNQVIFGIAVLEKSALVDPKIRDTQIYLGYGYLKQYQFDNANNKNTNDDLKNAKMALEQALKIDPLHPLANKLLGITYFELGDAENSQLCYNKAKEFEKNSKQ